MRVLDTRLALVVPIALTLCIHYTVQYTSTSGSRSKERMWRAVVCVVDHDTSPALTAIWWLQIGRREADLVQIPVQALIDRQTGEHTPTLGSLYGTPDFAPFLRYFVRYALGLPTQSVIECNLQDLLDHAVGNRLLTLFIPDNTVVVMDSKSVLYRRGEHSLSKEHLRELWSGYSFWGGEWGRMLRQRLILQAILSERFNENDLPVSLQWLANLRHCKVRYLVIPGTRCSNWSGSADDVVKISPAAFRTTLRRLWQKDERAGVQVYLCFSQTVSSEAQQHIVEEVFDSGYSVVLGDVSSDRCGPAKNAKDSDSTDARSLQAIVQKYARWKRHCEGARTIQVWVE